MKFPVTIERRLSSGKEADVFIVSRKKEIYALKVYKDHKTRSFQRNIDYLRGKNIQKKSDARAIVKRSAFGQRLLQDIWIEREFFLLKKLFNAGLAVPQPLFRTKDAILMSFIGAKGIPAPRLHDVTLTEPLLTKTYAHIMYTIDEMYQQYGIIHGDLSPYNILFWKDTPYIIDFPQAIDIRTRSDHHDFLERDKNTIIEWYEKQKRHL